MKSLLKIAVLALIAMPALADVSLNGVRIVTQDTEALAKFYSAAFGMSEVQRIPQGQNPPEIMLNFGKTPAAAQATRNKLGGGDIVIMYAAPGAKDEVAHIVLNVTDIEATVAALKTAGGKMERDVFVYGGTIKIGMAIDPAGNHIEMIQGAGQVTTNK